MWHEQIAWDDEQKLTNRRLEREQGRSDASDDLSGSSEGEKEQGDTNISESIKDSPRINSDIQVWSDDEKSRSLYIVLIRYYIQVYFQCDHKGDLNSRQTYIRVYLLIWSLWFFQYPWAGARRKHGTWTRFWYWWPGKINLFIPL